MTEIEGSKEDLVTRIRGQHLKVSCHQVAIIANLSNAQPKTFSKRIAAMCNKIFPSEQRLHFASSLHRILEDACHNALFKGDRGVMICLPVSIDKVNLPKPCRIRVQQASEYYYILLFIWPSNQNFDAFPSFHVLEGFLRFLEFHRAGDQFLDINHASTDQVHR